MRGDRGIDPETRQRPALARALLWGPYAFPVLVLLAVYVAVLYWRAFAVGVLSDGWVLLEIGSQGFRKAPSVLLSYHTIPVTNLLMAALWKLFGLTERGYQLTNLAELVLVGWLLYLLGCALFRQPRVGLLASLLFLANSSFYEVPFWPTVGNFQSLAALLYLVGVFAVHRAFHSSRPWPWLLLFSLCGLAAFFTYEPAISVLGVGLLYAALVPTQEGQAPSWRQRIRPVLTVLAASAPALAVVLGSKLYTSSRGYQTMFLPADWWSLKFRIFLIVRGCVAIFSLVGADHKLFKLLTFGLTPPPGSVLHIILVLLWCLLLAGGAALLLWKSRSGNVRFLTLWFVAHLVTVAAAIPTVSRHFYLAALPASLLLAWVIWRGADAAASGIARWNTSPGWSMPEPQIAAIVALVALALLAINAKTDLDTAGTLHKQATEASRQVVALVQQRLAQNPGSPPRVALVNMPASLAKDGMGAYAFVNGLHPLLKLSTRGRITNPDLFYTYALVADGKFANASLPISVGELAKRVGDPTSLVLMFDARTRTVAAANRANWRIPTRYDSGSAPYLEWEYGGWPWFRIYAGQPLELPLATPTNSPWVALKFLHSSATSFSVTVGSQPGFEVRPRRIAIPHWPTTAFPLTHDDGVVSVAIRPDSEIWLAGIWSFSPPAAYTPEVAPFLTWILSPVPAFAVEEPLDLPLAPPACPDRLCPIRLEYWAERGRNFSVAIGNGPARELEFSSLDKPEWRSVALEADPGRPAVVRIAPRGTAPILVHLLSWPPESTAP